MDSDSGDGPGQLCPERATARSPGGGTEEDALRALVRRQDDRIRELERASADSERVFATKIRAMAALLAAAEGRAEGGPPPPRPSAALGAAALRF